MLRRPYLGRAASRTLPTRGSAGRGGGVGSRATDSFSGAQTQLVVDPGFASAPSHTIGGTGIGTSAVAGGVLQITSVDHNYYERPAFLLEPLQGGVYTVVFTILNYVAGTISITSSSNTDLSVGGSSRDGTSRSANGTFTENIILLVTGYIGLRGQAGDIVNNMQIDNLTVVRQA